MNISKLIITLLMLLGLFYKAEGQERSKIKKKEIEKWVKNLEKDGWKYKPDASFDVQLTHLYGLKNEKDADGKAVWFIGEGKGFGSSYDAARNSVMEFVKQSLKDSLVIMKQTKCDSLEVLKTMEKLFLSRSIMVFDAYREMPNGMIEVLVCIAIRNRDLEAVVEKDKKQYR